MDANNPIKKVSMNWMSPGMGASVRCPVEGCFHTSVNLITKAHLRLEHGMTRKEVVEKFGYPEITKAKGFIVSDNSKKLYNSAANIGAL